MRLIMILACFFIGQCCLNDAVATGLPDLFWKRPELKANHFLINASGSGHMAYKDELSSGRRFSGPAFSIYQAYERHSMKKLVVLDAYGQFGLLGNGLEGWNQMITSAFNFRTNFAWMYHLPISSKFNYYLGPAFQHYSMFRLNPNHGNAALAYDVSNNLGVRARLEWPIPIKTKKEYDLWIFSVKKVESRKLRVGMEFDLPLVGLQSRPPFTGTFDVVGNDPASEFLSDFFGNTRGRAINSFFFFNSQTYFRFPLANGNALQLSYFWQGYRYTYQEQQVRTATRATMFSFIFRFDSNKDIR